MEQAESVKAGETTLDAPPAAGPAPGPRLATRRREVRYPWRHAVDWDFFTLGSGAKPGLIDNLSEHGCLLRTVEPIEHRRWLRLVVREPDSGLFFTAVGRVIRREDRLEAGVEGELAVTLHRYGVEFVHALNSVALERVRSAAGRCAACGASPAPIADLESGERFFCVRCHLRAACRDLLTPEPAPRPA
jgi:hypothetical protein